MHHITNTVAAPTVDIFDPSHYPRTYRVSTRSRVLFLLLGALILAGSLIGAWYFGTGHETTSAQEAMMLVAVCLALAALGGVTILYMLTSKVILYVDAIEVRDFLRVRRLRYEDIAGRRSVSTEYVSTLVLVPQRPGTKQLKITQIMQTDPLFAAWLTTLPDLDAQELEKSASEISASREIGRTPQEREARLVSARKIAKVLTVLSAAVAAWGYFLPEPYEIAIAALAVLPLIGIVLVVRFGRLYQIVGRQNDARANLAVVFIGPAVVLGLRAILDIELFDFTAALVAALLAAVVLTFVIAAVDRVVRERYVETLAMVLIASFYTFGAIVEANALLDPSQPKVYQATVINKHKSSGKTTTYYLRLSPWGPRQEEDDVSVSPEFYDAAAAGQRICVVFHAGALEMAWFIVTSCDRG